MSSMQIDIINPKAAKLLKNLEDLNLNAIRATSESGFATVLKKLRSNSKIAPTFEEISNEVEIVGSERYAK